MGAIKTLKLPKEVKEKFISYVQTLDENPYIHWKKIRYDLSEKFISILKFYNTLSDIRVLLEYINNNVKDANRMPGVLIKNFPADRQGYLLDPPTDSTNYNCHDVPAIGKKHLLQSMLY